VAQVFSGGFLWLRLRGGHDGQLWPLETMRTRGGLRSGTLPARFGASRRMASWLQL
jgi:hypothetical protein